MGSLTPQSVISDIAILWFPHFPFQERQITVQASFTSEFHVSEAIAWKPNIHVITD